jgi:dolichol-phosphate mannosyltransferase
VSWQRFVRFNAVSAIGVVVQLATLTSLTRIGVPYLVATALAVGAAVVHNFLWHRRWTWRDRRATGARAQFVSFALANGAMSLVTNLVVMAALVSGAHVRPAIANLVAIAAAGLVNFVLGDRVVFRDRAAYSARSATSGSTRDARHAGSAPANTPITSSPAVAVASATGSCGDRP